MRIIISRIILIASIFIVLFGTASITNAGTCWFPLSDGSCGTKEQPYCTDGKCSLSGGIQAVEKVIGKDLTDKKGSVFIKDIVLYFLGFVTLIAVLYVIYAGFQLMTGAGDEEKTKKARNIILYTLGGIIIMWLAYSIVSFITTAISKSAHVESSSKYSWSLIPTVSAAYSESEADTFREYQNKLRVAIQELESELKINKSVNISNIQNVKSLVQSGFDRLPDFGEAGTQNDTMKRAVDRDLELAMKSPSSTSQVGNAISSVAAFISSAKIESVQGGINATPGEGNAPVTVSFEASGIKDPSGATPDQMSYIWWVRENGGVRRELGRGKSLVYTFQQEGSYTVFLDVISGSRNSKKRVDVLPLSASKTIEVKSRLGEVVLLVNGVNVSNLDTLKINPTIGKMGVIFDATASRATGGNIIETKWNFGNGNTLTYNGSPIVERQIFANDGDYSVSINLKSNNGQAFTKNLRLIVRNPSAVIQTEKETANVGDDVFFSSISYFNNSSNVDYSWQVQDDNNKRIINNIPGSSFKHKFDKIGKYIVTLTARSPNGDIDTDSRMINIESRAPVVNLDVPKSLSSESPNIIVFDASRSYDPDTMGKKGLTYTWRLDGEKISLEDTKSDGAKGTFKFKSVGEHIISVTVANIYGKVTTVEQKFNVTSILAANILITPRVAPLGTVVNFIAQSENADFFEWNMGDGSPLISGNKKIIQHTYQKTGVYDISMTASSAKGSESNQIRRRIYVTDTGAPFAMINISNASSTAYYDRDACGGSGATVINRSEVTSFDATKSINVDGSNSDLSYTWTYFGKIKTTSNISEKLVEIGCYPIKLTVRSNKTGATHTTKEYLAIKNLPPELTSISTSIDTTKKDSQKVLVRVNANGASDADGVITSYIWYYTTESDREPQNIQITQKPEITFVLPNITEKYYFGVILEDNDGAKTNSIDEGSEQVPLILDNQNGNIYMPLISLNLAKTTVLVGENFRISAEAKTIVGTNITKNAEYAWDFDGDGKFDEKGNSSSMNYVYKKSGTYQVKLKVTYNGVSNIKYTTITVKNPLKANVEGYELPDGSLYFMNTSDGSYDTTVWNIGGESIVSPYTLTVSNDQVQNIDSDIVGTMRVSLGSADTSLHTIKRSEIIKINSSEGISYQTSPRSNNNEIHIKSQSDKLVISQLGNISATRYEIDSDTRIDNDLDGIPDNDIDNKDHGSYGDGSAFIITDFAEGKVRERKIRLTVHNADGEILKKDITVILDFLPEGQSVSGEDGFIGLTDAISTFDKAKLEELAGMIRDTDGVDRVVLMQKYNLMIENWGDSFSKAKSLIDIQEIVSTTTLTDDKKASMISIIDALLIGDAATTDEVTLATKLIQDLIPTSSKNRDSIIEKLNTISSHPNDLEKNKVLGKEILELVKVDPTIEDTYKIHIKNQLLIIINGGQSSVPAEQVESTEPTTSSSLMGFISGVVWIFVYIIGGILLVLVFGYVFYLLGRKNKDTGFQDFLIDSIFHVKKSSPDTISNDVIVTPVSQPPAVVNPKIETNTQPIQVNNTAIDPLAEYKPIAPSAPIDPINAIEEPKPLPVEEVHNIPSWLQVNQDDPLGSVANNTEVGTNIATQDAVDEGSNPQEVSNIGNIDITTGEIPAESNDIIQGGDNSGLIADTNSIDTLQVESPKQDTVPSLPSQDVAPDALPNWLIDSIKGDDVSTVSTPTEEIKQAPKVKTTKKDKIVPKTGDGISGTNNAVSDIPDWLK